MQAIVERSMAPSSPVQVVTFGSDYKVDHRKKNIIGTIGWNIDVGQFVTSSTASGRSVPEETGGGGDPSYS